LKKGNERVEKKVTGLTVKSLTDLESAVVEAGKKIGCGRNIAELTNRMMFKQKLHYHPFSPKFVLVIA
jgi:hypothetical protein